MKYREFGNTSLKVSEIGFGGWAISGNGYGKTDDEESIKTVHSALDNGINFIDTADSYGNGHSETLIGKVLTERKDNETIIATKFGWDFYGSSGVRSNLTPDYINFAVDNSLRRLKRDRIDIYQIHSQKPDNVEKFMVFDTLEKLKKDGKIRFYGYSVNYISDAIKFIGKYNLHTIQIPYNLIARKAEETVFNNDNLTRLGIICREPLHNGFLTGKYSLKTKFQKNDHRNRFTMEQKEEILKRVSQIKFLAINCRTLTQSAINFCLQNEKIGVVIVGVKNREQLGEILDSRSRSTISRDEMNRLNGYASNWI